MKTKVDGNQGHADGQSKKKVAGLNCLMGFQILPSWQKKIH